MKTLDAAVLRTLCFFLGAAAGGAALPACTSERTVVVGGSTMLPGKATREVTLDLDLRPGDALAIEIPAGSVDVVADELEPASPRSRVRGSMTLHARTAEEAARILDTFRVGAERGSEGTRIALVGAPVEILDGRTRYVVQPNVDLEVFVPTAVRLSARAASGSVSARGPLGSCHLSSSFGKLLAEGVAGEVRLRTSSGNIAVRAVRGPSVDVETDFGSVEVEDVEAPAVRAVSSSGNVSAERCAEGDLTLETSFGRVSVREASGSLTAKSGSGAVDVAAFKGRVEARSGFGGLKVDGVLSRVVALTKSGSVDVTARPGSDTSAGWTLESGFGGVVLHAPPDFAARISAESGFGSVRSDWKLGGAEAGRDGRTLRGTVGSGGGSVELKSASGAVRIVKSGG